jgi:hypothetical protein
MPLHATTFEYLKPTDEQVAAMARWRTAAAIYAEHLEAALSEGPDKTYIMRRIRETAMWVNVAITRQPDGTPRQ